LLSNGDPAAVAVARESVRLAFVAALQHLTPKQRAALILCDVLGWKAKEAARLLDTSTESVERLVRRARAGLRAADTGGTPTAPGNPARTLVDRYVDAFSHYDVEALVALLHEDVTLSMPPYPLWLRGIEAVRAWLGTVDDECKSGRFLSVAA